MVRRLLVPTLLLASCKPDIEGRPSRIDSERLLAVRSLPAEVTPNDATSPPVGYSALYVAPGTNPSPSRLEWAFCLEGKPLVVAAPVALDCLAVPADASSSLSPLDADGGALPPGVEILARVPLDACNRFGPDPPTPKEGEPQARPADPDITGGYYQPVRAAVRDSQHDIAVGVTRLSCGLALATGEQSIEYARKRKPNENPRLDVLTVKRGSTTADLATDGTAPAMQAGRGETLGLTARWAICPEVPSCGDGICSPGETAQTITTGTDLLSCPEDCTPAAGCTGDGCRIKGCTGSEPYLLLDPASHVLGNRHETMTVSWYATDGNFDHDRTGRTSAEFSTSSTDNVWTAPTATGQVRMWLVVRDDRGGVGWSYFVVDVQ